MGNSMIKRIDISNGVAQKIVRVAGTNQKKAFGGDGGPAIDAQLRTPQGLWVANDGTVYVSDGGNNLDPQDRQPGVRQCSPDHHDDRR